MNNVGLKNSSQNLVRELPVGKAYINLCPAETNLILVVPLVEEMGINYIFNYLSRNKNGSIGKGGNVSFYRKLDISSNRVINADFSIDEYVENIENKETGLTLRKTPDDHYGLTYTYSLNDKNDGSIIYNGPVYDYPCQIISPNKTKTRITTSLGKITVASNNYSTVLKMGNDGFVKEIEYKHKEKVLKKVTIVWRW